MAEEMEKLLQDVRYFVTNKMNGVPSDLNDQLKGWPELMRKIANSSAKDITFEQLRDLEKFTGIIIDPKNDAESLNLPPMVVSDYRTYDFGESIARAKATHPGNEAYKALKEFYVKHIAVVKQGEPSPLQNALYALNRCGFGYEDYQPAINRLRSFIGAIIALDPECDISPRTPENYDPDLARSISELSDPRSVLRNPDLDSARKLCERLNTALGVPIPKLDTPNFKEAAVALAAADAAWPKVVEKINRHKVMQPAGRS